MAYKSRYETQNVGDSVVLELGEVNATQYRRVKDNNTSKTIKDNKQRFRIIDKINVDGKRYQLNGTLTEIVKSN